MFSSPCMYYSRIDYMCCYICNYKYGIPVILLHPFIQLVRCFTFLCDKINNIFWVEMIEQYYLICFCCRPQQTNMHNLHGCVPKVNTSWMVNLTVICYYFHSVITAYPLITIHAYLMMCPLCHVMICLPCRKWIKHQWHMIWHLFPYSSNQHSLVNNHLTPWIWICHFQLHHFFSHMQQQVHSLSH